MKLQLKPTQWENLAVWFISLAIVFGNGYMILVNHDASFASDERTYLALANGDPGVHIAFRYRVLVPFMAKGLASVLQQALIFLHVYPESHHLPLGTAFFLLNSFFMAFAGLVLYRITRFKECSRPGSLIALTAVLTSGYATYITGLALTDSLYFLVLCLLFYALITENASLLFLAVVCGPLAKESFWLFLPFIFLSLRFLSFPYLILQVLTAALVFWGLHLVLEAWAGPATQARLENVNAHLINSWDNILNLFRWQGLVAVFSTFGIFNFLVVAGLWRRGFTFSRPGFQVLAGSCYVLVVIGHMVLSGDFGRMWYFSAPVFALAVAKSMAYMPGFNSLSAANKEA